MIAIIDEIAIVAHDAQRIVGYTAGVFDLLHHGHLNYLKACRERCDFLVVGVDVDDLVKQHKGQNRPYQRHEERLKAVEATGLADAVFLKSVVAEFLLPILRPHRYFVPNNRKLTEARQQFIAELEIEADVIGYTEGISTSVVARQLNLGREDKAGHD